MEKILSFFSYPSPSIIEYYNHYLFFIIALGIMDLALFYWLSRVTARDNPKVSMDGTVRHGLFSKDMFVVMIAAFIVTLFKTVNLYKISIDIQESVSLGPRMGGSLIEGIEAFSMFGHQIVYPFALNGALYHIDPHYWFFLARFVSVFFSFLSACLFFKFAYAISAKRIIAYWATAIFLSHGFFTFYSLRVEVYVFFLFFVMLSYYYYWNTFIVSKEESVFKYSIATILAFLMHYIALFVVASQFLTLGILRLRRNSPLNPRAWLLYLKSVTVVFMAVILYLPIMLFGAYMNRPSFKGIRWQNIDYLSKDEIPNIVFNLVRILLGSPGSMAAVLLCILVCAIIFIKLKRINPPLFLLMAVSFGLLFVYEICFIIFVLLNADRAYFNLRHVIWFLPFIALLYGYGAYFLTLVRNKFIHKAGIAVFVIFMVFNVIISSRIVVRNINPDYRLALEYINEKSRAGDGIIWRTKLMDHVMGLTAYSFLSGSWKENFCMFKSATPKELLAKKGMCKRLWVVIPKEDFLGVLHLPERTFLGHMFFLKRNFSFNSVWSGNKIKVYLFETSK